MKLKMQRTFRKVGLVGLLFKSVVKINAFFYRNLSAFVAANYQIEVIFTPSSAILHY
jgi:hypothetical protein